MAEIQYVGVWRHIDCDQIDDTVVDVYPECGHFHGSVSGSASGSVCCCDIEVLLEDNSNTSTCSVQFGDGQGLVSIWAQPFRGDVIVFFYLCFCEHTYI